MQGLTIIKCVILDKEVLKLSKFPAQAELIACITMCVNAVLITQEDYGCLVFFLSSRKYTVRLLN